MTGTPAGQASGDGPLAGLRVLVPRAPERAGALLGALRRAGADPVAAPLVLIEPPADTGPLDDAVTALAAGRYDWLAVTSGFTVDSLESSAVRLGRTLADVVAAGRAAHASSAAGRAAHPSSAAGRAAHPSSAAGRAAHPSSGTRVAAVGDATAAALGRAGVDVDYVPTGEQSARGMLTEWPGLGQRLESGARGSVLVPQGDLAEPTLSDGLRTLGLRPDVVTCYRNVPAAPLPADVVADLASGAIAAVVLTSGSTARRLAEQVTLPSSTLVCSIGPRAAEVAAQLGLPAGPVADGPHPRAVVDALVRAVAAPGGPHRISAPHHTTATATPR